MIRRFAAGTALATGLALSLTGCLGDAGAQVVFPTPRGPQNRKACAS